MHEAMSTLNEKGYPWPTLSTVPTLHSIFPTPSCRYLVIYPPALSGFHFNELTEDLSCLHDHHILEWTLSMESPRDFQEGTWEAATIAALHSIRQTPPIEGQFGAVKSEA